MLILFLNIHGILHLPKTELWTNIFTHMFCSVYGQMWCNIVCRCGAMETGLSFTTVIPSLLCLCMNLSKSGITVVPHHPSPPHVVQCNIFSFLKLKLSLRGKIFYGNCRVHLQISKHRTSKDATNNGKIMGLNPSRNKRAPPSRITWNTG
jgi:hypothetical protein